MIEWKVIEGSPSLRAFIVRDSVASMSYNEWRRWKMKERRKLKKAHLLNHVTKSLYLMSPRCRTHSSLTFRPRVSLWTSVELYLFKYSCNLLYNIWEAFYCVNRTYPPSSHEEDLEANTTLRALDSIPLPVMRNFATRCSAIPRDLAVW